MKIGVSTQHLRITFRLSRGEKIRGLGEEERSGVGSKTSLYNAWEHTRYASEMMAWTYLQCQTLLPSALDSLRQARMNVGGGKGAPPRL